MEERLQAEWSTHLPDQVEKEQAISKLATQVEEQVSCIHSKDKFVRKNKNTSVTTSRWRVFSVRVRSVRVKGNGYVA